MDLNLFGHKALVSGAWRGTGLIIAKALLAEGASVLVHGFTREQAETGCAEAGGGTPVWGDITTDEGAATLLMMVADYAPDIDILINNYGTAAGGQWRDTNSAAWVEQYEHNVLSAQRLIQGLLPGLRQRQWGRIINLGTVGSTRPNNRMPHYYAAKGALATMTISLARELAGTGIRVNLVSPGLILTPEVEAQYLRRGQSEGWGSTWEEIEPHVARNIPIGRIVRREEIAHLICFLASPLSDALHGQNIRIDGGSLGVLT